MVSHAVWYQKLTAGTWQTVIRLRSACANELHKGHFGKLEQDYSMCLVLVCNKSSLSSFSNSSAFFPNPVGTKENWVELAVNSVLIYWSQHVKTCITVNVMVKIWLLFHFQSDGCLVTLVHSDNDADDEESQLLWKQLCYLANMEFQVKGLTSGYCKDVHGQVSSGEIKPEEHPQNYLKHIRRVILSKYNYTKPKPGQRMGIRTCFFYYIEKFAHTLLGLNVLIRVKEFYLKFSSG